MPLPDDILPEETPNPNLDSVQPAEDGIGAPENDPSQLVGGLESTPEDTSFGDMSNIAAIEFDSKNPQPTIGSELPPNLDLPVPQPDEPQAVEQPAPVPQSYKDRQAERKKDFDELKQQSKAEFDRKHGKAPAAPAPAQPTDDKEEFGNAVNAFNASGGAIAGHEAAGGTVGAARELMDSDFANREQMGEMLVAYARRLDQMTRFLEMQRL